MQAEQLNDEVQENESENNDIKVEDSKKSNEKTVEDIKKDPVGYLNSLNDTQISEKTSKVEETERKEEKKDYTQTEKQALKEGWLPKERYQNADDWVSASQYLKNGQFLSKFKAQSEEINDLKQQLQELVNVSKMQNKIWVQEKAEEAKKKSKEEIENGRMEEAYKYEKAYQDYSQQAHKYEENTSKPNKLPPPQIPNEALLFQEKHNSWFNDLTADNSSMKAYAIATEKFLINEHPEWHPQKLYSELEIEVKRKFPDHFSNDAREFPSMVEDSQQSSFTSRRKKLVTFEDLPLNIQHQIDGLVRATNGRLTREEYFKTLEKSAREGGYKNYPEIHNLFN